MSRDNPVHAHPSFDGRGVLANDGANPGGVFVAGCPALFLTPAEKAWRALVGDAVTVHLQRPCLTFTVASFRRNGNPFDLDNLAHPVLAVVAPSAESIWVRVREGEPEGVHIVNAAPPLGTPALVADLYLATPPLRSVKGGTPVLELAGCDPLGEPEGLGLRLAFDATDAAISDFGFEGPIKALIDELGPMLGSYHQGARDYRIHELRITPGHSKKRRGVRIGLWHLDPRSA